MKLCIVTMVLLFLTFSSNGQYKSDTTVRRSYIDSLKRELADLKQTNNFLYWSYQEKIDVVKIDTVFIRPDSSVISYLRNDEMPLKRQFNILDRNKNIVQYTIHYYEKNGLVRYIEHWDVLRDGYFDGKLSSAERNHYDSLGREILNVKYLQSARRTIRNEYWYDQNGERRNKATIIEGDALWDE